MSTIQFLHICPAWVKWVLLCSLLSQKQQLWRWRRLPQGQLMMDQGCPSQGPITSPFLSCCVPIFKYINPQHAYRWKYVPTYMPMHILTSCAHTHTMCPSYTCIHFYENMESGTFWSLSVIKYLIIELSPNQKPQFFILKSKLATFFLFSFNIVIFYC